MATATRCNVPYRQPLLFQPVETLTPFSFSRVVDEARSIWFPEIDDDVETRIASLGPLASIWHHRMGRGRHVVVFHPILNRPDVPYEVVRFIAKHELTHIAVPGPGHSRAFWEKEYEISPEQRACWKWINASFGRALVHNPSGLWLRYAWRERVPRTFAPYTPHLPFDDTPWSTLCPGGGAQLRFDPVWSRGPAPLASPLGSRSTSARCAPNYASTSAFAGSGIGSPLIKQDSTHAAMASSRFASASAGVSPLVRHPGSSATSPM